MNAPEGVLDGSWDSLLGRAAKFLAAVLMGLGAGLALRPGEAVVFPVAGSVPNPVVGLAVLAVGGVAFYQLRSMTSGCGCEGECTCS